MAPLTKRLKVMATRNKKSSTTYRDNFTQPVGSVSETRDIDIIGTGGSRRHSGSFREDNAYLDNLLVASKNQDMDALYERAVEDEADYNRKIRDLKLNYEVLKEQREYDSPLAEIQRQREAGYNPDIAGASGASGASGGSSAQLQNSDLSDVSAQTKFSNKYDNTSEVFNGLNTSVNVLNSLVNLGSSIVTSIATLKKLPTDVRLGEASASLADAQANQINETLPATKTNAELQAIQQQVGILGQVQQFLTPDSTDADVDSIFRTLGYSDDKIESMRNAYRTYEKNDALQAYYAESKDRMVKAEARNSVYTPELYSRILTAGAEAQLASDHCNTVMSNLKSSFGELLSDNGYFQTAGENILNEAQNQSLKQRLDKSKIKQDILAFENSIDNLAIAYNESQSLTDSIIKKYTHTSFDIWKNKKVTKMLPIPDYDQAILDAEEVKRMYIKTLGSNQLNELYSLALGSANNAFLSNQVDRHSGMLPDNRVLNRKLLFSSIPFSQVVSGELSSHDATRTIISKIPFVGDLLNIF